MKLGVNIDDPAKFREARMSRSCISKNWGFRNFGPLFTDQSSYAKLFFGFRASSMSLTSDESFMVIRPVVFKILGGVVPPPRCQYAVKKSRCYYSPNRLLSTLRFNAIGWILSRAEINQILLALSCNKDLCLLDNYQLLLQCLQILPVPRRIAVSKV